MPKFPKAYFRSGRGWYVQVGKQQIKLADGPESRESEAAALKRYYEVMSESGRVQSATPPAGLSVVDEYDSAKRTTFNAFHTSPTVITAMHQAITGLGVPDDA